MLGDMISVRQNLHGPAHHRASRASRGLESTGRISLITCWDVQGSLSTPPAESVTALFLVRELTVSGMQLTPPIYRKL